MTASPDRPFVHVTDEDTTITCRPTAEQARAIGLLELATPGCPLVRLSLHDWKWVDRVVCGLGAMGVPAAKETAVVDGYCTCEPGLPMRDCGMAGHRLVANRLRNPAR